MCIIGKSYQNYLPLEQNHHIKVLFHKFLQDQCTSEEIEKIITYLKISSDVDLLPEVEEVKTKIKNLPTMGSSSADRVFRNILDTEETVSQKGRMRYLSWYRLAAVISGFLLLAGLSYLWMYGNNSMEYTTDFGETQTIFLPDGTEVVLNAHSQLLTAKTWEEHAIREVWLQGEAYFSVVHTTDDQKFMVHTSDDFSIEVLGTEFNVSDRRDKTSVVLSSGKVKVKAHVGGTVSEQIMQPGDKIEYEEKTQQITQQQVDTKLYTSWKDNLLIFDNAALSTIAEKIQDHFGYQVIFQSDSLASLRFTGSNPASDMDLLLKTLEKSFDLHISKNKNQIIIKNDGR